MANVSKLNGKKVDKRFKKGLVGFIGVLESFVLLLFASIFICAIVCVVPYFLGGNLIVELLNAYLVSTTFLQLSLLRMFELSNNVTILISLIIIGILALILILFAIKNYMKYRPGGSFGGVFKIVIFSMLGINFMLSGIEAVKNMYPLENYIFLCFLLGVMSIVLVILNFVVLLVDKHIYKKIESRI